MLLKYNFGMRNAVVLGTFFLLSATTAWAVDTTLYMADTIYGWENNRWADGSQDCEIPPEYGNSPMPSSTEWHSSGSHESDAPNAVSYHFPCSELNALKIIKAAWGGDTRVNLAGKTCVCTGQNANCVKVWGHMAYLGGAYDLTFTTVGFNNNGCGTTGQVNGRLGGYIRLKSDMKQCIQTVGDVSEGQPTQLWGDCGTGDRQQRRVMSYMTSDAYQTIRVAADDSYCLSLKNSGTADGNPIVTTRCSSTDSDQKKWLYKNHKIRLKADTSKCMLKVNDKDIQLGPCVNDDTGKWMIQWTLDH